MTIWTRRALTLLVLAVAASRALSAEQTFDRHFTTLPGGRLTLDTDFGSVAVVGHDGRELTVHAAMSGSDDYSARVQIQAVQGPGGVTVTARSQPRSGWDSWLDWWFGFGRHRVLYTIAIPRDYGVDIYTAGGGIDVRHVNASVRARTSGGSITLRDVSGSIFTRTSGGTIDAAELKGPAELRSSGGSIEVTDSTGDLNVSTSGGRIALERVDGKVSARTSGGGIEAQLVANRGASLFTAGGSIALLLPAQAHAWIDAHTSGGRVESALPMSSTEMADGNELRGSLNGGGEPIWLRSSGGSIHIGALE